MTDKSLARRTARELARLIRERAVSPIEVLDAHLAVIENINPTSTPSSRLPRNRRATLRVLPRARS